jgi:hypothetical protein
VGFVGTLIWSAWFSLDYNKELVGIFGFGGPLIISGLETSALWWESKGLLKILGFTAGLVAVICTGCLVLAVAEWILRNHPHNVFLLFMFGLAGLASGSFAIRVFLESEEGHQ